MASAQTAPVPQVTAAGVGGVNLGASYRKLRQKHLVGPIRKGCPLASNTRSARLLAPMKGIVDFTRKTPRRVVDIFVEGGAAARGVGIGATIQDIQAAYPSAIVNHGTEPTFRITLVEIPRNDGGRIQFGVDVDTKQVSSIGIPFIAFCE